MTTKTDHRANIGASWERRLTEMRALTALAQRGEMIDGAAPMLEDYGYGHGSLTEDELQECAQEIAASYALSIETYYLPGERHPDGSDNYVPVRVEMALTLGGPTVIVTYDVRGAGWSGYFHSWGKQGNDIDAPDRTEWEMSSLEHGDVGEFLACFYVPELD